MIITLAGFLPAILIGILVIAHIHPKLFSENLFLALFFSISLGTGITSCSYFLWSYFSSPNTSFYFLLEVLLIIGLALSAYKRKLLIINRFQCFASDNRTGIFLSLLGIVMITLGIIAFSNLTQTDPHGRYDAWAIWNLRARLIARSGLEWKLIFNPAIFHADYPLLLPLSIARIWVLTGKESLLVPQITAFIFTFLTAGVLGSALYRLKSQYHGWLSVIVLLGTPWIIFFGSKQFADLPQSVYILCAVVSFAYALTGSDQKRSWIVLSGLFAGLAGWTKNEGMLFIVCFISVSIPVFWLMRKTDGFWKNLGFFLGGLSLPLGIILLFKLTLAPANDLIDTGNFAATINLLISPDRYSLVWREIAGFPEQLGGWKFPVYLILIVFVCVFFDRIKPEDRLQKFAIGLILLFQWVGYFLIFVITPHDIHTHVVQAYDRLLVHIYPSFLFWLFLLVGPLTISGHKSAHVG
jgi:hypothetical protein